MTALYLALPALLILYHLRAWRSATRQRPAPLEPRLDGLPAPRVSLLVPVWGEADLIPGFVEAYRALAYPDLELVLCAGGDDGSHRVATRFEGDRIAVLEQFPGEGKQAALARCFAHSTGSVVYITDIDCRLDTASFAAVLEPILEGREQVVTGSSIPWPSQREVGAVLVHWATVRKVAGVEPRPIDGVLGRNCAATRSAVEAIGAFRYEAPTGTDYRMAQRLAARGYRVWFEPRSEVHTQFAWPLRSYVRKRARWLRNVVIFAERPRQNAELLGALLLLATPFGLLALLLLALLLAHPLPALLALLTVLHGAANRVRYAWETLPRAHFGPRVLGGSLVNLFATLAAGVYATVSLLSPSLRKQW